MDFKVNCKFENNRDDYLLNICRDKRVLHIGACDWPYTEEKFKKGELLHSKLSKVSNQVLGIDISTDSIKFLQDLGYQNITFFDMNDDQKLDFEPEIIIFGETIEHLTNLDNALSNLKKVMSANSELVISTPNAFYIMNFINSLRNVEKIHPDHKLMFSLQTLKNLLNSHSFIITDTTLTFLNRGKESRKKKLFKKGISFFPLLAETLVLRCKNKE